MTHLFQFLFFTCSFFSCAPNKSVQQSENKDSSVAIKNEVSDKEPAIVKDEKQINYQQAYFTVTAGGTQMINENGQAVTNFTISRFIVLEFAGNTKPIVNSVKYNTRTYSIGSIEIQKNNFEIGKTFSTGQSLLARAGKNSSLWKLDVTPSDGKEDAKTAQMNIIVKGLLNNKPFTIEIPAERELQAAMMY